MGKKHTNEIKSNGYSWVYTLASLILAVFLFLFAIDLIGASLNVIGQGIVQSFLLATSNPFIGLFIGLLATAIIQSSSTVTAMTVAIVATGYLSLQNAIPVVMGANVGTTLTSTLVALGFVTDRNEFRKAISAGSIHDFYNIIIVVLLFPLEYNYGFLSKSAIQLTAFFGGVSNGIQDFSSDIGYSYSTLTGFVINLMPRNILTPILSLVLLFISIKLLSSVIYTRLIGSSKENLKKFVFNNPYKSFGWGALVTAGMQSSSITTSLMVPLVASGKVKLSNAFPLIMGANIGTTITALLAAFNRSEAAISLAFVHLLFNLVGVVLFLPFPVLRRLPVNLAYRFGMLTLGSRAVGFSYILITFFLLPFTLISLSSDSSKEEVFDFISIKQGSKDDTTRLVLNSTSIDKCIQYNLFHKTSQESLGSLPDTSFTLNTDESFVVTSEGAITYDTSKFRYGNEGTIISLLDSVNSTDSVYKSVKVMQVSFKDSTQLKLIIDPVHNLAIETKRYHLAELIESCKLVSLK